jgi:ring-1,2-phenylacetyl-CoA epoxidase subunit PaaB
MYGDPSEPDPELRAVGGDMPHYTRAWSFDPYHQTLTLARRLAPDRVASDTEWAVWEVFQQARRGEHHQHVGSLHAPDAEIALVLAKESFARRGECVNLWVVPAQEIFATAYEDADIFQPTTDKDYREPAGYHGLRKTKIHGHGRGGNAADGNGADG